MPVISLGFVGVDFMISGVINHIDFTLVQQDNQSRPMINYLQWGVLNPEPLLDQFDECKTNIQNRH